MTCGLRSLRWAYLLMVFVALILALLFAVPGIAASPPPSFAAANMTVQENAGVVNFVITKSAKAKSYSKISVQTIDGSALAGTDYIAVNKSLTFGNNTLTVTVPITINDNTTYGGDKAFAVRLTCIRNCQLGNNIPSVVTITDNETQTPPPQPEWAPAQITEGGYVRCKRTGGCVSASYPCPAGASPPANCSYHDIVVQQGTVMIYRWNGVMADSQILGAFWPLGHDPHITHDPADWYLGTEGPINGIDWEGVVPGTPTAHLLCQGLKFNVISTEPNRILNDGSNIIGAIYSSDTTGKYLVPPGVGNEIQYFSTNDIRCPGSTDWATAQKI